MNPRVAPHRLAYLPPKISQVATVSYTRQVTECFIDTVYLDTWAHFLKRGHHPLAHVAIEFIVAGEGNDPLRKLHLAQLEPGHAHFYAKRFGFAAACYHTAIIIRERHNGLTGQIRTECRLATRVKRVHINQREHCDAGYLSRK